MTDLTKRLRTMSATGWHPIGDEAADEIDRLRAAVQHEADCAEAYRAQVETLTRERDELSDEVALKSACINGMSQATDKLAGERDEARAERDEFAMDAKRYAVLTGWLARHGLLQRIPEATRPDGTFGVTWVLHPPKVIDGSRLEGWSATTAACAIDSALAQEQPK